MTAESDAAMAREYVVIPMEEQHTERAAELWRNRFGTSDGRIDKWLSAVLNVGGPTEGFVASDGGNVLGFSIGCLADADYVDNYLEHPDVSVDAWPKTGILHMLCVDKDHESKGIGTDLTTKRLRWLAAEGCEGALAVSWHRDNYRDSRLIYEKLGFDAAAVVDEFYETLDEDVHCVDCEGACTCGSTVFKRRLDGGFDG